LRVQLRVLRLVLRLLRLHLRQLLLLWRRHAGAGGARGRGRGAPSARARGRERGGCNRRTTQNEGPPEGPCKMQPNEPRARALRARRTCAWVSEDSVEATFACCSARAACVGERSVFFFRVFPFR
jgi:hypothetical protein